MGRPTELTKEKLQQLGITDITLDGHVFVDGYERAITELKKESRFKTQVYKSFVIYDKELYERDKHKRNNAGLRTIILSRAIWAWNYDGTNCSPEMHHYCKPFTCPANLDVDHVDDDSTHDELSNYQLLTRKENIAKRKGHVNQYK